MASLPFTFETTGYDGSVFSDFEARRSPSDGPGWFIFGRNSEKYGTKPDGKGMYVKRCGWRRIRLASPLQRARPLGLAHEARGTGMPRHGERRSGRVSAPSPSLRVLVACEFSGTVRDVPGFPGYRVTVQRMP